MQLRKRLYLLLVSLSTGILLTLAHPLWLPAVSKFLVVADPLQPADAIVSLAGGFERVEPAAQLFRAGYASWFIATDVVADGVPQPPGPSITQRGVELGVPREHICPIQAPVSSTYEEAQAIRELAQTEDWQSLIVVTSPYHTRRSRMIFREVFAGTGIDIIIRPVAEETDTSEYWWDDRQERQWVVNEYLKLGAFLVGVR